MPAIDPITVLATATSVVDGSETGSRPMILQNASSEDIVLDFAGSTEDYTLDPGERITVIPGMVVTATSASGTALLLVLRGVVPGPELTAGGGPVGASGSAAVSGHAGIWSVGQNDFTAVRASDTTLTLGTFPTAMGTVRDEQFALVVVTDSAGVQRVYTPTANAMTIAGQVLTVTGGFFAASDIGYDVYIWGPPKGYDGTIDGHDIRVLNPSAVDSITGADMAIAYDHHEIHAGHAYHVSDVQAVDTTTQYWMITTPDTLEHGHMVFSAEGTGEIAVTITEGADRTGTTALTAINRNRNSVATAGIVVHRDYTLGTTNGAVTIWQSRSGSTSQGGNLSLGGAGRGRLEYILKQNTKYIVAIQVFAAIVISLELDWYEHEDAGA
jgi:hypothetical protein